MEAAEKCKCPICYVLGVPSVRFLPVATCFLLLVLKQLFLENEILQKRIWFSQILFCNMEESEDYGLKVREVGRMILLSVLGGRA